jgi:enoyl-CoA hydratase/carnithine racemase
MDPDCRRPYKMLMTEVIVSRADGIVEIRLDRAAKKNALTAAMYRALTEALTAADTDDATRAVLLTAAGETFCAGNDIADFLEPPADLEQWPPQQFITALVQFSKPLVAAVHGAAVGIGTTMLLHCDLVYASASARFRTPFVSLGLVPEAASSVLLPARVGHAVASEMLLLGAWIDANRAERLGLVNAVLPSAHELAAFARERAGDIAKNPPGAVRMTKALLRDKDAMRARVQEEGKRLAECLVSPEARQAFTAFLARRY